MTAIDRREFLKQSARTAVGGVGVGLLPGAVRAAVEPEQPRVRRTVALGDTGLHISDIGFGSSRLRGDEGLVRFALERGISYFDTARSYTGGRSEETIGRALRGRRHEVVLASKIKVRADDTWQRVMSALEESLRSLQTDHIDVYFNHAVNDIERLANPEWHEFNARAKAQGKIRFAGMSGHGGNLVECLDYAVEHALVDVVLVGYNFGQDPAFYQRFTRSLDFVAVQSDLPAALARASGKGVGVVAMKTLRGARLNDMRPYESGGGTFAQAAFRWTLSNSDVDALIVTMKSPEMVEEYLGASGWLPPVRADVSLLDRYEARNGASQCRYGCNACATACPEGVPIAEVLRTRMYAEDYGDLELARADYAELGAGASPCLSCAHRACTGACPFGLDIPSLTSYAATKLRSSSSSMSSAPPPVTTGD